MSKGFEQNFAQLADSMVHEKAPALANYKVCFQLIDKNDDPERDQIVANLAACQNTRPLTPMQKKDIEDRVAALHGTRTTFFQRPSTGFQPPQNVEVKPASYGRVARSWHNS